jgi:hypothetical protein
MGFCYAVRLDIFNGKRIAWVNFFLSKKLVGKERAFITDDL